MPGPVLERALRLFPDTGFVNAYGLTETSSTIAVLDPEDHRRSAASDDPAVRRRLSSAGRPGPGIEVMVADEEGRSAATGAGGEICARGPPGGGVHLDGDARLAPRGGPPPGGLGVPDPPGYLLHPGR